MITGRVYMIVGSEHEQVYIGSTTNSLGQRFTRHKSLDSKCMSKILINDKEVGIYLIEETKFEDRTALRWRERYWWELYNTINIKKPIQTREERLIEARERSNSFRINNPEIIIIRKKKARQKHLVKTRESDKIRSKTYRQNNIEYIKDRNIYQQSWGGDKRYHNNLLKIELDIFK